MIYKIDHYYNNDHETQCLLIESSIETEQLIKILASIQFKFEELIDESVSVDEDHILIILKEFYGVKDVKEKYKKLLPHTKLKKEDWETVNIFRFTSKKPQGNFDIIQIDLYEARESCCGKSYTKIMNSALPKGEKLEQLELIIKGYENYYKESI